ncbi:hypothetical protein WDU94_012481 [Cyamophila willieti]
MARIGETWSYLIQVIIVSIVLELNEIISVPMPDESMGDIGETPPDPVKEMLERFEGVPGLYGRFKLPPVSSRRKCPIFEPVYTHGELGEGDEHSRPRPGPFATTSITAIRRSLSHGA